MNLDNGKPQDALQNIHATCKMCKYRNWLKLSFLTLVPMFILQALLASGYSQGNYKEAQRVIYKVLEVKSLVPISLCFVSLVWLLVFLMT